jgi:hypothetical protein
MDKAIANYERLQGYITIREENVAFLTELVKLQLQYCGLLSHCDMYILGNLAISRQPHYQKKV